MSNVVEDRIINLKFNNKDFEKNAAQSMRTIDALEEKLTFKNIASKGVDAFKGIINAARQVPSALEQIADAGTLGMVSKIKSAFTKNGDLFSPLMEMATGAFRKIGEEAYSLGKQITTSLTTQQIDAGWEKYADKTRSVQTIMNATGKSIDVVTEALAKLNWYSDETSYSYTDMTSNIAKFTSSGVDLNTAVTAMIGIGNAAGLAGAQVQDASHAMSGFAKAIGQGYMDRMKWSWIETAQMDTQQFKKSLIEAAVALGTLRSNGDGTYSSAAGKNLTSLENFEADLASGKWMTAEVMLRALQDYGALTNKVYSIYEAAGGEKTTSEILDEMGVSAENLGLKAFKASQEAKTFADAIDSVKDAVSTGWMTTFDTIFGDYEEAKKLWTDFANWLYDMFAESGNYRNSQFEIFMGRKAIDEETGEYYKIGEQMLSGREYLLQAIYKFMEVISAYANAIKMAWDRTFGAWDFNTIGEIAKKIHRVAEILGATLEKDLAMDPKEVDKWEWLDNQNRNSFIVKFRIAMERLFGILKESVETIKTMGTMFYDALYEAFGDKKDRSHGFYISGFYKWFNDITLRVAKFIKTIRQVITENNRLQRILTGNFSVLKIFFNIISEAVDFIIQNGGGVIAIIAEILASLGDFATSFDQSNLYDFVRKLFPLINNAFEKLLKGAQALLSVVGKVKDFILDFFVGLDNRMGESGSFQMLINGFKHLGEAISNLLGFDKLGDFFKNLGNNTDGSSFLDSVVTAADAAVAALGGFFDLLAVGITKIKAFADTVASVASNIGTSIGTIVNNLFGSKDSGTRGGMPGMEEDKKSIFDLLKEKASSMLTNMFSDVDNEEVTRGATRYTGSIIDGIIEALKNAVNNLDKIGIDFEKIKFLGYFVGFIVTLINLNKTLRSADDLIGNITDIPEAIGNAIANWGSIGAGIKSLLDEIKESLSDLVELEKIQTMAKVIATLSMVVMLLATIPEQDLAKGVVYLGLIGAIFVAFNKAMGAASALANVSVMKNSVNITKSLLSGNTFSWNAGPLGWAAVIISMGYFVTSFVNAINTMTSVDGNDVVKAAGVVLGIIGAFFVVLGLLGKLAKDFQTSAYSYGEKTLSSGVKTTTENRLTGTSGKFFYGIAAAMLALSVGIKIVVDAIKVLTDMIVAGHGMELGASVAVVFGIMASVFLAVFGLLHYVTKMLNDPTVKEAKLKTIGKSMLLLATSMAIMAASVDILIPSVIALTLAFALVNDPSAVGLAMGTMLGIMAIMFGGLIWIMNILKDMDSKNIKAMGKAMVLMGAAMAIIAGSMAIVVGSIIALVLIFTVEHGISRILGNESDIIIAITTVGLIMVAIMAFTILLVNEFTNISDSKITKIGNTVMKIAEAMVVVSASVAIMAISMAIIAKSGATIEHGAAIGITVMATMAALLASMYVYNKLGVKPKDLDAISKTFLSIAGAIVLMAVSVAILSIINPNTINDAFGKMIALIAVVAVSVAGLAFLASRIPGAQAVITAFAAMLTSIALMMASVAATTFGFATAVAVLTKCIKPLTDALDPFTVAFVGFLDGIKDHVWTLIPLSIAISIFAATIAGIVIGSIVLIIRYRSQIGAAISSLFTTIQGLFTQFGTWFSGLPKKTQLLIKSFALAISAGLVSATPEMYSQIEAGFMLLMERLGDSVGWITEGLFALVVNVVNGLADAIRNNSSILAYAIYNALESIGTVLIDLLTPLVTSILAPIWGGIMYAIKGAEALWEYSFGSKMRGKQLFEELENSDFIKDWTEAFTEGTKELKDTMALGTSALAEFYGVDPTKQLETLSQKNREKALAEIEKGKNDLKKHAEDATSAVGDGAISGLEKSKNKLDTWFAGKGLSYEGIKQKLTGGMNLSDLMQNFLGEDGLLDTGMFDEFTNQLSLDGYDVSNITNMASAYQSTDQSITNLTDDVEGFIPLTDEATASYERSAEATDSYVDSLKTAEDAEEAFGRDTDSMVRAVEAREDSFYSAGETLADAVERGINDKWPMISLNITTKFKQLADDIRKMLEMGDLTVSISSVTPVYNANASAAASNPVVVKPYESANGLLYPNAGYYAAQEQYGQIMSARVRDTINTNKAASDAWAEFTGEKINDLYEEFHEYNTTFGAFKEDAQAFYKKDPNIYLDKDTLVGTFSEELKEPLSVHFARLASGRGW